MKKSTYWTQDWIKDSMVCEEIRDGIKSIHRVGNDVPFIFNTAEKELNWRQRTLKIYCLENKSRC